MTINPTGQRATQGVATGVNGVEPTRVRVGVVGSSGYAGSELLRILLRHPHVQVTAVASRTHAGKMVSDVLPAFRNVTDLRFMPLEIEELLRTCDFIMAAVPHGVGMELAPAAVAAGARFIDLGPDFRFDDAETYERWYKHDHAQRELLSQAVYGLPELHREKIRGARLVGNPGCYPTATILGLSPLVKDGLLADDLVSVVAMSGISGAGSNPGPMYHLPEATENVRPYGVPGHRHTPEIEKELSQLAGRSVMATFVPHLMPMSRGIMSTSTARLSRPLSTAQATELYQRFYAGEPFVRVLGTDRLPQTKGVLGSNFCDIAVRVDERAGQIIVMSAIDNLCKGAAGQAVQNLNLMCGFDERSGLDMAAVYP